MSEITSMDEFENGVATTSSVVHTSDALMYATSANITKHVSVLPASMAVVKMWRVAAFFFSRIAPQTVIEKTIPIETQEGTNAETQVGGFNTAFTNTGVIALRFHRVRCEVSEVWTWRENAKVEVARGTLTPPPSAH